MYGFELRDVKNDGHANASWLNTIQCRWYQATGEKLVTCSCGWWAQDLGESAYTECALRGLISICLGLIPHAARMPEYPAVHALQPSSAGAAIKAETPQTRGLIQRWRIYIVFLVCDDRHGSPYRNVFAVVPKQDFGQEAIILILPFKRSLQE